jgi:hypothetical protein
VDPITLFALANGAVSAVKAGCKLYKDIKGAAADVKGVLKDLDEQFHAAHPPNKPATVAQRNAFVEEKNRVMSLSKQEPTDAYDQIGQQLSVYFENMAKCVAIWEEEEKHAKEVYTGDDSIGKRALGRVLMRKKLEQMGVELRELMVYQSPPELGALYSDVEEMMKKIGEEQKVAIAIKIRNDVIAEKRRKAMIQKYYIEGVAAISIVFMIGISIMMMAWVVQDRIEKYPQLGTQWIPKTEAQRREEAKPKIWVGR